MFCLATFLVTTLPFLAAVMEDGVVGEPTSTQTINASQCNSGSLQCCNSVQQQGNGTLDALLGAFSVALSDVSVPVGLTCTPIDVLGITGSGSSCDQQPVCCTDASFKGIIALGCIPVDLSL